MRFRWESRSFVKNHFRNGCLPRSHERRVSRSNGWIVRTFIVSLRRKRHLKTVKWRAMRIQSATVNAARLNPGWCVVDVADANHRRLTNKLVKVWHHDRRV